MIRLSPTAHDVKGVLFTYLAPRLAQDAKLELSPLLEGLTARNFAGKAPLITAAIQAKYKGRLAKDADLEDLAELLEAVVPLVKEEEETEDEMSTAANSAIPVQTGMAGEGNEEECARFLKEKGLNPEDCATAMDIMRRRADDAESEEEEREREKAEDEEWAEDRSHRAADARMKMGRDESEEEKEKREKEESEVRDAKRAKDRKVNRDRRAARDGRRADDAKRKLGRDETEAEEKARKEREGAEDGRRADDRRTKRADDRKKAMDARRADDARHGTDRKAMDAAIDAAVGAAVKRSTEAQRAVIVAREEVRPWVGALDPKMAFDADTEVFKKALDMLRVDTKGVHPSAYKAILGAQPVPGSNNNAKQAHDSLPSGIKPAHERFPNSARVTSWG